MDRERCEAALAELVGEAIGADPHTLDRNEPFALFNLDSATIIRLTAAASDRFGRAIDITAPYEHPTIRALAAHIVDGPAAPPAAPAIGAQADADVDEVVITGMACRVPGASDPYALWTMLEQRTVVEASPPPPRVYDRSGATADGAKRWRGNFLSGIELFDPLFFGIAPRETESIDPQQRLLLEVCWEALQDAGLRRADLARSRTGVYVGISNMEYAVDQAVSLDGIEPFTASGSALSIAANRISYTFDLIGPSVAIDTACSSSLVALHMARRAILADDCDIAIVGGVNLILSPLVSIAFDKAGVLSGSGRCRSFAEGADGYVRGEGAVFVILRRRKRAEADGDRIYAVVKGGAVNQDGRSNGLMAPNPESQKDVIRRALRDARLTGADVDHVEAHGTGTVVGDSIETRALGATVGVGRKGARRCRIGSIKSNIGHLEAAAGLAGVVKTALMLHRGRYLACGGGDGSPSGAIPFDDYGLDPLFAVPDGLDAPRVCGVSSFGFGGTNAHVLLGASPRPASGGAKGALSIIPITGTDRDTLTDAATRLGAALRGGPTAFTDLAYTLCHRRDHLPHRIAVVSDSIADLVTQLDEIREGRWGGRVATGAAAGAAARSVAFVFPGQGGHWWEDFRPFLQDHEVARALDRFGSAFKCFGETRPIGDVLAADDAARLGSGGALAQASFVAAQVALATALRAAGLDPRAVVGHSLGEVSAAVISGALTPAEGIEIAWHRGQTIETLGGQGRMAVVELSRAEALDMLGPELWIAASNGPSSTVIAGTAASVDGLVEQLESSGIFARTLAGVTYASHGPAMEPVAAALPSLLSGLLPRGTTVDFWSTVTTGRVEGSALDGPYWGRNVTSEVRFDATVRALRSAGTGIFVEVAPRARLSASITASAAMGGEPGGLSALGLRLDTQSASEAILGVAAQAFAKGADIGFPIGTGGRCTSLPAHGWSRRAFWRRSTLAANRPPPEERSSGARAAAERDDAPTARSEVAGATTAARAPRPALEMAYVAPRTPTEAALASIWEDALGVAPIGVDDPLFRLGADSLFAAQIITRLNRDYGVTIRAQELLQRFDIATVAALVDAKRGDAPDAQAV